MRVTAISGLALCLSAIGAVDASAAAPSIFSIGVSKVTSSSVTLEASINPASKLTRYHFEYGPADCASNPCTSVPSPEGEIPAGTSPVAVPPVVIEGLAPGTVLHFRVLAKNGPTPADKAESPDRVIATYPVPLSGLPDGRAYEQASPVDKDGGDVIGIVPQLKAPPQGGAVSFSSTVGIPGGVGAQEFPLYLARRGADGWSTQGVLPPPGAGQKAVVVGWLPDFSQVFSSATKIGDPSTGALVGMPGSAGKAQELTPYLPKAEYTYVGSAGEGSEVVFESKASLGSSPAGVAGSSNVYAWDRESGEVSLISVDNEEEPAKGAFGGSYDWAAGMSPTNLSLGGAARSYYTQDQHAVAADGSVFFTEAGTGQLYMRLHPTKPQSKLDGQGKCEEPEMACTIHVSESQRTPPDPAGPRPAAFMGASADGSAAFFTSPEKLTDNANTGPPQPKAKIGRSDIDGKTDLLPAFLDGHHAVGVAVDAKHLYWADPSAGTIGRSDLDGSNANDEYITGLPTTTVEEKVETELGSGEFEVIVKQVPSSPRYVAVGSGHIYWTNTADGKDGQGTIGRAAINPTTEEPEDVEAECVKGASNPQGIAVNSEHIYWANAGSFNTIGRAELGCGEAQPKYYGQFNSHLQPQGVALTPTHVYWAGIEDNSNNSSIRRLPLEEPAETQKEEFVGISNTSLPRGIAAVGEDIYWAAQGEEAIGHAVWPDANPKPTTLEEELISLEGAPSGIAVDATHIYWSTNGETLPSPGNDLYRFAPDGEGGGELADLTPDIADEDGAEVQGVVGVSGDGSHVYFTANADLDGAGPAQAGDCVGPARQESGQCSLYLWSEGGGIGFVARLSAAGSIAETDATNWAPTTTGFGADTSFQKTAFLSADGQTLLFRSQERLSAYDNEGVPELYRYREGEPIACVSCKPTGEAPEGGLPLTLGSIKPSALPAAAPASLASRSLSADGKRAFFETTEALVASDTNGVGGCLPVGAGLQQFPVCRDVYEWEAPGSGSCEESSSSFSPLNEGCLYLISTGKDDYPSFFADASADGKDVFLLTRQGLVGQDKDELLDVYDARVGGGIAAQSPPAPPPPCEGTDSCHGPIPAPPGESSPSSQTFVGPGNEVPKKSNKKAKKPKKKHKAKKKHKKQGHRGKARAGAERGAGR